MPSSLKSPSPTHQYYTLEHALSIYPYPTYTRGHTFVIYYTVDIKTDDNDDGKIVEIKLVLNFQRVGAGKGMSDGLHGVQQLLFGQSGRETWIRMHIHFTLSRPR